MHALGEEELRAPRHGLGWAIMSDNEKVYCRQCRYHRSESNNIDKCSSPNNTVIQIVLESAIFPEHKVRKLANCHIVNKNNDCKEWGHYSED